MISELHCTPRQNDMVFKTVVFVKPWIPTIMSFSRKLKYCTDKRPFPVGRRKFCRKLDLWEFPAFFAAWIVGNMCRIISMLYIIVKWFTQSSFSFTLHSLQTLNKNFSVKHHVQGILIFFMLKYMSWRCMPLAPRSFCFSINKTISFSASPTIWIWLL